MKMLTENDRSELEKFRLYLNALSRWDKANGIDDHPLTDMEGLAWRRKQIKAHAAIYEQIYGEKP